MLYEVIEFLCIIVVYIDSRYAGVFWLMR